jgi:YVTN family beta-propeller protein
MGAKPSSSLTRFIMPTVAALGLGVAGLMVFGQRSTALAPTPANPAPVNPTPTKTLTMVKLEPGLQTGLPGMPGFKPENVYAFDHVGAFSPVVVGLQARVYVPDGKSNKLSVIDPKTFKVIATYSVDKEPQHVVPAYDLKTLYVVNDVGNTITPIDPRTSTLGKPIKIQDPYNLYFTPDGLNAIVVAEYKRRLDFFDPHTWQKRSSLSVSCKGINHMDFSSDGRFILAACEFSGDLVQIDLTAKKVIATLHVGGMPQDVKLSPDGKLFYVADMMANGLHVIDASTFKLLEFIPTGKGAHGLYPSRDAKNLYISNRGEGSISVLEFATRKLIAKWRIPGGGSPDMGSVSADGTQLWLAGRNNGEVYVFDTRLGKLAKRIKVGRGPHGLTFFPQPGRYSLGHTGVYR